jgi:hypothetical protein
MDPSSGGMLRAVLGVVIWVRKGCCVVRVAGEKSYGRL